MAPKLERVKKNFISTSVKSLVTIIGLIVCLVAISYANQDIADSNKKLKLNDRRLLNRIKSSTANITKLEKLLITYKDLEKSGELRPLKMDRKQVSLLLKELSKKYNIENLSIDIPTLQENNLINKKTGKIVTTQITVEFGSISDSHAFAFTEELLNRFSGYLNVNSFSIYRHSTVSETTLEELIKTGSTNFINSQIEFEWFGLQPNKEGEK